MQAITQLKVAHLTSVHRASDTRISHRECSALMEAGYDVVLIATGSGRGIPRGIRFNAIDTPRNRFERMTRTMFTVYRKAVAERAQIYHFHDPELIVVGLALRLRGAQVIFDVHEDIPRDILDKPWIPKLLRWPVAAFAAGMLRLLQRSFSAIVAATPAIAKGYPHPHKAIVSNYPNVDELTCSQKKRFSERPAAVVYVGEISRLRGAGEMVRPMSALPPAARLILVGPFEDHGLGNELRATEGWNHVDYLGPRHRTDLSGILAQARAGLLLMLPASNHNDALPTKVFEYMAAGLPVVVSNAVPLAAQIVQQHECGVVVDPTDVKAVAAAIRFFLEHPDEAEAMGERGRRAAIEQYQWATEARKLTGLYAQIA